MYRILCRKRSTLFLFFYGIIRFASHGCCNRCHKCAWGQPPLQQSVSGCIGMEESRYISFQAFSDDILTLQVQHYLLNDAIHNSSSAVRALWNDLHIISSRDSLIRVGNSFVTILHAWLHFFADPVFILTVPLWRTIVVSDTWLIICSGFHFAGLQFAFVIQCRFPCWYYQIVVSISTRRLELQIVGGAHVSFRNRQRRNHFRVQASRSIHVVYSRRLSGSPSWSKYVLMGTLLALGDRWRAMVSWRELLDAWELADVYLG